MKGENRWNRKSPDFDYNNLITSDNLGRVLESMNIYRSKPQFGTTYLVIYDGCGKVVRRYTYAERFKARKHLAQAPPAFYGLTHNQSPADWDFSTDLRRWNRTYVHRDLTHWDVVRHHEVMLELQETREAHKKLEAENLARFGASKYQEVVDHRTGNLLLAKAGESAEERHINQLMEEMVAEANKPFGRK